MCGRYALALRASQIARRLREDDMPVYEAPDDPPDNVGDDEDDGDRSTGGRDVGGGYYDGPRQSYNFAPGYKGVVYRADVPDWGAGPRPGRDGNAPNDATAAGDAPAPHSTNTKANAGEEHRGSETSVVAGESDVRYKLQTMKWGLVPFWTKRNPGYGSMMKTINCRDDSLAQTGGMWASMKARKRCVIIAQGFYEWLKKNGGREKLPHYVRRKDGKLMCLAGLWDVVQYESDEEKHYTYTIITTDSNKQLNFLHDRMPVILDNGSEKLREWLDPGHHGWSKDLQSLLMPYDGELEVYPVSKDVGKVGNNSPTFIIPIDSKENKSNIANFFAKGAATSNHSNKPTKKEDGRSDAMGGKVKVEEQPEIGVNNNEGFVTGDMKMKEEKNIKREDGDRDGEGEEEVPVVVKREAEDTTMEQEPPHKMSKIQQNVDTHANKGMGALRGGRQKISAMSNPRRSPAKTSAKAAGTQKITKFFANSS
ncbi:hypothetical protein F4808DRAFT_422891 [Astrocystis sublimbata]|nr:hypothetical protein F4808DRAFT_422891 [Astrocystis sublimbata]